MHDVGIGYVKEVRLRDEHNNSFRMHMLRDQWPARLAPLRPIVISSIMASSLRLLLAFTNRKTSYKGWECSDSLVKKSFSRSLHLKSVQAGQLHMKCSAVSCSSGHRLKIVETTP